MPPGVVTPSRVPPLDRSVTGTTSVINVTPAGHRRPRSATMTIQALHSVGRPALSKREIEVLIVWLACDSKQQAARRLFVSESTVHTHITRIRDKYRVVGRPAPTKIALLLRSIEDDICTLEEIAGLTSALQPGTVPMRSPRAGCMCAAGV
ncbi:helix-turn-helix transcriptional regulator [Gordonia sp. NPDC127522]|uniref:helix-turn-helix transcriptional regulator n=1 Tax=Gordonia sp. NPDC127522 TaxID=3345390 RepID=UPI00362B0E5A